jgi:hypothetical protein
LADFFKHFLVLISALWHCRPIVGGEGLLAIAICDRLGRAEPGGNVVVQRRQLLENESLFMVCFLLPKYGRVKKIYNRLSDMGKFA